MWHASRMKMVNFQPGWDSLNWCQDVKSKMLFSSEIPKYLRKENTWRFYLYWGLLICKSRANLIFQVLPDYIWFLWTFALNVYSIWWWQCLWLHVVNLVKGNQVTAAIILMVAQCMRQNEHPVHRDEYSCHDSWQAYFIEGVVHLQNTFCTTCSLALAYVHLQ